MAITSKRAEIEDRLLTIISDAGVGFVVRGQLRLVDPDDFYRLLTEKQRESGDRGERLVRGWSLYRTGRRDGREGTSRTPAIATNHVGIIHTYQLDGVYGYDMKVGSERSFNDMVDTVMNVLADVVRVADYDLRVTASDAILSLETVGDVTMHLAEIRFTVEEDVART